MTGWIVCNVLWRSLDEPDAPMLRDGDEVYLVLGPVPARPPHTRWTLLNMRTGVRKTIPEDALMSRISYRRVA